MVTWRVVENNWRDAAANEVEAWGYFREVSQGEREECTWFVAVDRSAGEIDELGYLWFTQGPDEDALAAHVCTAPGAGCWLASAETMHGVEIVAGLLGANRIYSILDDSQLDTLRVPAIKRWLRIRGWVENQYGMCRGIGE